MGQIIKSVCVCLSVGLSVCEHSHGRISLSIFTKIGTDVRTPKSKNEFVGGQYRTTPSPILPQNPHFRPRSPENTCKYYVRESPKFMRLNGNRCRETRWWRQILDGKWKYGRFAHAQWKIRNITLIHCRIAEIPAS